MRLLLAYRNLSSREDGSGLWHFHADVVLVWVWATFKAVQVRDACKLILGQQNTQLVFVDGLFKLPAEVGLLGPELGQLAAPDRGMTLDGQPENSKRCITKSQQRRVSPALLVGECGPISLKEQGHPAMRNNGERRTG